MKKPILFAAFILISGWAAAQDAPQQALKQRKAEEKKSGSKTAISASKKEAKKKQLPASTETIIDVSAYMKDAATEVPQEEKKE